LRTPTETFTMKPEFLALALLPSLSVASPAIRRSKEYHVFREAPIAPPQRTLLALTDSAAESTRGGAFVTNTNTNTNFTFATGTFTVPQARVPEEGPTANNPSGLYTASFWVGLDGFAGPCMGVILRTGVDIFYDGGIETYVAWHEWYPNPSTSYSGFGVAPGDVVRLNATARGSRGGAVSAENLSTGTVVSWEYYAQSPSLCGGSAEWIVEDFELSGVPTGPVPLANFSVTTFSQAFAEADDGNKVGVDLATVLDINLTAQGGRLTRSGVPSASEVVIQRVFEI
jgi:hypothetical protein